MTISGQYTSSDAMLRLMGEDYYEMAQSDLVEMGFDDDMLQEIIDEADSKIDLYVSLTHDPADLATSKWIQRRATWVACHLLSRRRGNPGNFRDEYEETLDDLERIKAGELTVPGLARYEGVPAVSQTPIVDQRFRSNKLRVDGSYSTDTQTGKPFYDPATLYEWF